MPDCKVALYGCGTVGMGVANILLGRRGVVRERLGDDIELAYIVDKRKREIRSELSPPESVVLTDEVMEPLDDDEVDVVVELFGGTGVAKKVTEEALKAGKQVVSANKALLAAHGNELYRLARAQGSSIAFEASVAGGVPIINSVRGALVSEDFDSVYGIVNGTCNYILTRMSQEGLTYQQALKEAQEKGYAEADPTLDVEGDDSAHKLAVLARLAFGVEVDEEEIYREGVSGIDARDICYARSMGYTVKLLAIGIRREGKLQLSVHPALLDHDHPLAAVGGAYNAVCVHGDSVGEVVLTGLGAGRWPTASAVVGDICQLALGTYQEEFASLRQFGEVEPAEMRSCDEIQGRYYFRLNCDDRPGVLAQVAGVLGNYEISIANCMQQDRSSDGSGHVPVVFMTHMASEGAMNRALDEINHLDAIDGERTRMLRVQDI